MKTTEVNLAEAQKRAGGGIMRSGKLLLAVVAVQVIDKTIHNNSKFNVIHNLFKPAPVASPARDSAANAEEVKTLKYQITEAKREILSRLTSSVIMYCTTYTSVDAEFQDFCFLSEVCYFWHLQTICIIIIQSTCVVLA